MSSAYRELPALPIVAPLAILAFAVLLWHLRRRGALTVLRALVAALACAYGAGVIANTLFPIYRGMPGSSQAWTDHLNLIPLADTELADMLQNVLVFLPLGVLLPLLGRVRSATAALLGGLALSLTMEVLQLANDVTGHGGHIADVNDLLANTLGCVVGYALFRVALLLPPVRRLATAATWPARRDGRARPRPQDLGVRRVPPLGGRDSGGGAHDGRHRPEEAVADADAADQQQKLADQRDACPYEHPK